MKPVRGAIATRQGKLMQINGKPPEVALMTLVSRAQKSAERREFGDEKTA